VVLELAGADLGSLQIAEDTERLALLAADLADHLDQGQLLLVGSMREVQADNIDACADQVAEKPARCWRPAREWRRSLRGVGNRNRSGFVLKTA